jgi:glycosyltransferase involved in cell wall biosynthesis
VHPLVSNEELLSRIAEHDIGFAGEETYCRSRELTVTNKLFQYLLGGLAIAASNTLGQCEIAADAGEAVQIYASGDVQALAGLVNRWIDDRSSLARARQAALTIAQQRYSWEREAPQVVSAADQAIFARATTC